MTGVLIMFSDHIRACCDAIRGRIIIRRSLKQYRIEPEIKMSKIGCRIDKLLKSSGACEYLPTPTAFGWMMAGIFFVVYITSIMVFEKKLALFAGGFAACIPYLIIKGKVENKRIKVSREGDVIVQEILSNYRIHNANMKEAIEETALTIENAEIGKKVLMDLSKGLANASSEEEIDRALEFFRYSFNSAWGNILATNIFLAVSAGVNVESSLTDLSLTISKSRKVMEEAKRANYESGLILKYLFPLTYISAGFVSVRYFDIPFKKLLKYQFGTNTGMKWFLISLTLYIVSIAVMKVLSEEKMDI